MNVIKYFIATVWILNGLFCKILNFVPRHEQIVSRILGSEYSKPLTILIGIFEVIMAIWILSNIKPKLNAVIQIVVIATMNILEFILVPNLLLWGRYNIIFASILILMVYYNAFYFNKKTSL
ncbi:DoxX-like family protein [Mariniflexile gromovii]|uniref:DoxX-like family protein n=1 Tax=Mariniflexile gromovii TaxID=362523 RepID=A0ABS4BSA6_9FLAO|nr:DoxX-like family protein [Mariniflexile gromovii]MBP0903456.1 DoxX-like family protein [Mariniflexile gromovii]